MNKTALTLILLLFTISQNFSQDQLNTAVGGKNDRNDFLNSSSSSPMSTDGEKSVDLYTGKINESLSIYEIKQGDLSVPVNLIFSTDGIKVDETAAWVGLGWNLSAGGYIEREVRGNPDEDITAYNQYGGLYYQNYGRFHDLLGVSGNPNAFQFPLGNTSPNALTYYINVLRNNISISCKFYGNNYTCSGKSQDSILELMAVNTSNLIFPAPTQDPTVYFWDYAADTQPDIFHFSTPTANGKFIFAYDGTPKVIESNDPDVKIYPAIGPLASSTNPLWKIVTSAGIIYEFPYNSNYTEKSTTKFLSNLDLRLPFLTQKISKAAFDALPAYSVVGGGNATLQREITNRWYLSKIKTQKNDDEILFTYQTQLPIEDFTYEEQKVDLIRSTKETYSTSFGQSNNYNNCSAYFTRPSRTVTQVAYASTGIMENANKQGTLWVPTLRKVLNPKYLDEIIFNNGKLKFIPTLNDRTDLVGNKALDRINLMDNNNQVVKSYRFYYGYYTSNDFVDNEHSTRLKLTEMKEFGTGTKSNKYLFEYNESYSLPSRGSAKQDYWGFMNNNSSLSLIPSGSRSGITLAGADRSPDEARMKTGMLKKIIYPKGGYKEILYEINKNTVADLSNSEFSLGGLRVKKIIVGSSVPSNNEIITEFLYEGGYTVNYLDYNWWRHFMNDVYFTKHPPANPNLIYSNFYVKRSSSPIKEFIRTKGGLVGYSKVTVFNSEGKTVKRFRNRLSHPDEYGTKVTFPFRDEISGETYHEPDHMSRDALRGLETDVELYNSNNVLVRTITNEYADNPELMVPSSIPSMKITSNISPDAYNDGVPSYIEKAKILSFCDLKPFLPYLKKTVERNYNVANQSFVEKTKMHYKESPYHFQVTRSTETTTDGIVENKFYFPGDLVFQNDAVVTEMKSRNIVNIPLKVETFLNGTKINEQFKTYFKNPSNLNYICPNGFYEAKFPNSLPNLANIGQLEKISTIHQYDDKGNVVEYSNENGIHTVIIWGYNKSLPIAKIENATWSNIPTNLVSDAQNYSNNGDEANLTITLNTLRNLQVLNDTMITSYTHYPLIGLRSIMDAKNDKYTNEYDEFGQLTITRNKNNHIVIEKSNHNVTNN